MLAYSFLSESSSKLLVTRTGIKARTSLISGLWFPWPIYMFFEMRFDFGTLDSGERSLPFGLLVCLFNAVKTDTKLTLRHMGKFFVILLIKIKFKIWRVTFLARLYEVQGELLQSPRSSVSVSAFPSHCDKVLFPSFPKVHISTATHQKAFIFGPQVPWRAGFHSMIPDPRVDAPGWGLEVKI